MKTIQYFTLLALVWLGMTGCYEDKGSYNTGSWTDIVSVEGMTVPGTEEAYFLMLTEDERLKIEPTIRLRPGVDESSFTYDWVMGSDTIGRGKALDWIVTRTANMEFNTSGDTYFWLAINNTQTGEAWRYFLRNKSGSMLKAKITQVMTPRIATFVYTKQDGTAEWGSVKGSNKTAPANFTSLYTELFTRYNTSRSIPGPIAGASNNGGKLVIYTNAAPDYGAIVQSSEGGSSVLGLFTGTVSNEIFQGEPEAQILAQNFYTEHTQEMLIGNGLYISPATSPYAFIPANTTPTLAGVAQTMGANPFIDIMHFSVLRTTQNKLYYYSYDTSRGFKQVALTDQDGTTIEADRIVGVFHQPTFIKKQIKMFVVAKQSSAYTLYTFTLQQTDSGNDQISYIDKLDVSSWAGGINDQTCWMTNAIEVPLNYLYIVNGNTLWRKSYESLAPPTAIKTFSNPISLATIVTAKVAVSTSAEELYMAVFTYNQAAGTSKMYTLDAKSSDLSEFSTPETPIPGKVFRYMPIY